MTNVTTQMFSLSNLDAFQRPGAKIEKRDEGRHAGCWVTLNGWVLSIQWGTGNYSDNYKYDLDHKPEDSTTAEIAVWREDSDADMIPWGRGEYAETVLGYVSMNRVQHILDLIERDELTQTFQPPPPPPELRAIDDWLEDDD